MKKWLMAVLCTLAALFCVPGVLTAFADVQGGAQTRTRGQTEIWAGVVVDYMGKLRFEVKDRRTGNPIPGASVELWIPGADGEGSYVLFGVTDENGVLELDVAYNTAGQENVFESTGGKLSFSGKVLYLSDNLIKYRVYKSSWLPYPKYGEVTLELKEIPQVVEVLLYKKGGSGGGGGTSGGGSSAEGPGVQQVQTEAELPDTALYPIWPEFSLPGMPKTGVESYALYWGAGCLSLLAAAGAAAWWLYKDKRSDQKQGRG